MKTVKLSLNDNVSAQILGLTDEHIHYEMFSTETKSLGIHHLMLSDYQALVHNAAKAGIELKIASGFRSFERQLQIWNNKFLGNTAIKNSDGDNINISNLSNFEIMHAILFFSALPGASRHHWGCDIDVYADNLLAGQPLQLEPWEYAKTGPMAKLSTWLVDNASKFGFYFPYDTFRGGVAAEPWHLSYMPLAQQYQSYLNETLLRTCLLEADIQGKEAIIEHLSDIFDRYILNVNVTS